MPKKKTIPPPDDFPSEFMETESAEELSEQQAEASSSDNMEMPLADSPEDDLGSGNMSSTADVGENEPDAGNTADAADSAPVSDEAAEDPEYLRCRRFQSALVCAGCSGLLKIFC